MTRKVNRPDIRAAENMMLPGHYKVLTLQMNYTRYHPQGTCRWVVILREPESGVEVDRIIYDLGPDDEVSDRELTQAIEQAIAQCIYLQTGLAHRIGAGTEPI